jgi:hypothetical protein
MNTAIDNNLRTSFHHVANDIISLENTQHDMLRRLERLEKLLMTRSVPRQAASRGYIGNTTTSELHKADCILARSTETQSKIVFGSRHSARQAGFTECICLA